MAGSRSVAIRSALALRRQLGGGLAICAALLTGCTAAPPPKTPEARTATPSTITRHDPGGDAIDAHSAALERLLEEPLGTKIDKFRTIKARFPDARNWTRVRFWGHPTRAGFRYGKGGHALAIIKYFDAEGDDAPRSCLDRFTQDAVRTAGHFSLEVSGFRREARKHFQSTERRALQRLAQEQGVDGKPAGGAAAAKQATVLRKLPPHLRRHQVVRPPMADMPVLHAEGEFTTLLNRQRYLATLVAYRSWPGSCLVQGFAVRVEHDPQLARAVIDRWLDEFAPRLAWSIRLHDAPEFANR